VEDGCSQIETEEDALPCDLYAAAQVNCNLKVQEGEILADFQGDWVSRPRRRAMGLWMTETACNGFFLDDLSSQTRS
jgi:hypothetical protein